MDINQLEDWLVFSQVKRFSIKAALQLLEHYSVNEILRFDQQRLKSIGFSVQQVNQLLKPDRDLLCRQLEWQRPDNQHIVCYFDDDYPELLKQTTSPPWFLFVMGELKALDSYQLAIVGTRNPSPGGKQHAYEFARQWTELGLTITSGLALGCDGLAHKAAVDLKRPTIAVLGTGIDIIYPQRHSLLSQQIIDNGGAIISEFPLGTRPSRFSFPKRNRIIAGMTLGTLVIEAAVKSGSLITARLAMEENRDVFAVPGSINNPNAAGCHALIRQGAKLVEQISDILEEYSNLNPSPINYLSNDPTKTMTKDLAEDQLLDSVGYEPTPVDAVVAASGLAVAEVLQQLLKLELQGLVAAVPGGYIRLRGS